MDLASRRELYMSVGLAEAELAAHPIDQFQAWYGDAEAAALWEPNAMTVSAVDADGWPASRYVLLKAVDKSGFTFYTNYNSAKAAALEARERAVLTFGWMELRRQVRVHGHVARVSPEVSDAYFASRPRGSQLGAVASPQSEVVADRVDLDRLYDEAEARVGDGVIERPAHWGGYRIAPVVIEFWQGRLNRLHDRLRYTLDSGDTWSVERLAP